MKIENLASLSYQGLLSAEKKFTTELEELRRDTSLHDKKREMTLQLNLAIEEISNTKKSQAKEISSLTENRARKLTLGCLWLLGIFGYYFFSRTTFHGH